MKRIGVVQMQSGADVEANLAVATAGVRDAAGQGASVVVLPENFAYMPERDPDLLAVAETPGDGPIQAALAELARATGAWLVAGSVPLRGEDPARVRAASLVLDDTGRVVARYDKLHLFDVDLGETGESYRESAVMEPGEAAVTVDTPAGRLGLSICFDLRFPGLFQSLLDAGAQWFAVPAAFTRTTGRAHWELLLRARAVEGLAFVAGAGQVGRHPGGRETFGHSQLVDPWGRVLACQPDAPGAVVAAFDTDAQARLRRRFPVLDQRRFRCRLGTGGV